MRPLLLTLLALLLVPATGRAAPAAVVDGVPIDRSVVDAEVRRDLAISDEPPREVRAYVVEQRVRQAWVRREADALGVVVTDGEVAGLEARERRLAGGRLDDVLAATRWNLARYRAEAREQLRRRKLFDRFLLEAPTDAAYAARFLAFHAAWRARTTCVTGYAAAQVCGSSRPPKEPCTSMGIAELCHARIPGEGRIWTAFDDVGDPLGAANGSAAQDIVEREIRRRRPALLRRIEFDFDADYFNVAARRRIDVVGALRIAHEMALRRPTPPLLGPYE